MKFYYIVALIAFGYYVIAADEETEVTINAVTVDYSANPYCFRFTWLGPRFNNESTYLNATCADFVRGATNVPCQLPLVVSENSNTPDTTYMWDTYKTRPSWVACRLVRGEVCAKFLYRFNGAVENITYLCTKVNVENGTAATSGCYKETTNGREVEVCVCESRAGELPCNAGIQIENAHFILMMLIGLFTFFFPNSLFVCLRK